MRVRRLERKGQGRQLGALTTELLIAMAILATVMLPLAFSFAHEQTLCRAYYYRAIALELLDGEMEALVAGEWKAYSAGKQDYAVEGAAVRLLPAGRFILTIEPDKMRLEWIPAKKRRGGRIVREVCFKRPLFFAEKE